MDPLHELVTRIGLTATERFGFALAGGYAVQAHMIYTCFALGRIPQYRELRLPQWAHMLGYRGHFSTKSRHYSTTLGALRLARAEYRAARTRVFSELPAFSNREPITVSQWRYVGSGLLDGEAFWAEMARASEV